MTVRLPTRRRPAGSVGTRILELRGLRVMVAADLAALYGVRPKALMQAVRRNIERFPADFMFQRTYDGQSRAVFDAIRRLREPPPSPPKRIGFTAATARHGPRARRRV